MNTSGPAAATNETANPDGAITTASAVRAQYLNALAEFAAAAAGHRLAAAPLAALYRLNAAYYLESYLPAAQHGPAVAQAIAACTAALPELQPCPRRTWTRLASTPRHDEAAGVRRLLSAGPHGDIDTLLAAQHTLEILPDLPAALRIGLLTAVERYTLMTVPGSTAGEAHAAGNRKSLNGEAEQLRCMALQNARPPRQGEIAALARCISRREPPAVLTQALASGLAFTGLVDALATAAAALVLQVPGHESALLVAAAHAVRRLGELNGEPAIGAWLAVARGLTGRVAAPPASECSARYDPRELALATVRSGDGRLIQAAEAALVESEALPAELAPLMLAALNRLLASTGGSSELPMGTR